MSLPRGYREVRFLFNNDSDGFDCRLIVSHGNVNLHKEMGHKFEGVYLCTWDYPDHSVSMQFLLGAKLSDDIDFCLDDYIAESLTKCNNLLASIEHGKGEIKDIQEYINDKTSELNKVKKLIDSLTNV